MDPTRAWLTSAPRMMVRPCVRNWCTEQQPNRYLSESEGEEEGQGLWMEGVGEVGGTWRWLFSRMVLMPPSFSLILIATFT